MSNRVLIDIMNRNNYDAGTKARNDVAYILSSNGFLPTVMFNRTHNNFFRALELTSSLRNVGANVNDNDIIVMQYPYQVNVMRIVLKQMDHLKKRRNVKFILLIHDVVYLRNESYVSEDPEDMKKIEVGFFNSSDGIIAHNSFMAKELKSAGVNVPIYELGLFDYIYNGKPATISKTVQPTIVFAGNLSPEKSGFIYNQDIIINNPVNLYGSKPSSLKSNYCYKGSFPPDELIESLEGNYGLVWDGPSAESCQGNYGNYLRYNNPHKFSLYIAAGLPVIVWEESALAEFVRQNEIGAVISSLSMLNELPNYDSEQYKKFSNNVAKLKKKVCNGEMLISTILHILGGAEID